jgi:SAM-dependent methyltransferase
VRTYALSNPTFEYQTITECRLCSSSELEHVVDLGEQPLANALLTKQDQLEGVAPLVLVRCCSCSAIQLSVTVEPSAMFRDYLWVTGTSASSIEHCAWLTEQIFQRTEGDARRVLEMASNDGTLLKEFQTRGANVLGVDPAHNLAEIATDEGIETLPEFFDVPFAENLRALRGPFDIVIARNVLSHVPDPAGAVKALAVSLDKTGVCVIEFHRADVIANELHYDSIYHEHTMYHTLRSMASIVEDAGLTPFDVLPSPISGGSWVLFAAPAGAGVAPTNRWGDAWAAEQESGVWTSALWQDFASRVAEHRETLAREITSRADGGQVVVAYGASARSSTVLNACGLSSRQVASIADGNDRKQGLFSPGTRIPIEVPVTALERQPDAVLLLAFNFREEIEQFLRAQEWRGDLINVFPLRVEVAEFT